MSDTTDNPLHDALVAHLRSQSIAVTDDDGSVRFTVDNPPGPVAVSCTGSAAGVLVVRAWYPHPIDAIDLPPVEELTLRANPTLAVGNLDVDRDRATVSFRTAVDFAGTKPDPAVIARTIGIAIAGMIRWMPPIAVAANGVDIDLALAAADGID